MIRERKLKSDFSVFKQNGNVIDIYWDFKPEVNRIFVIDEGTGQPEYTGEVTETDWCTCMHERYPVPPTIQQVKNTILKGSANYGTLGSASEMRDIAFAIGEEEPDVVMFVREMLLRMIERYDSSSSVNEFSVSGVKLWLDYELRGKVEENLKSCENEGLTETVLRINGMEFPMTIEQGWTMYYTVLSYARKCWNVTEQHKSAVRSMTSLEELVAYDYTTLYPEKPSF